jgi:hypothetical protein
MWTLVLLMITIASSTTHSVTAARNITDMLEILDQRKMQSSKKSRSPSQRPVFKIVVTPAPTNKPTKQPPMTCPNGTYVEKCPDGTHGPIFPSNCKKICTWYDTTNCTARCPLSGPKPPGCVNVCRSLTLLPLGCVERCCPTRKPPTKRPRFNVVDTKAPASAPTCNTNVPCNDNNKCTTDTAVCPIGTTTGECVFTPSVSCTSGFSCDPFTGLCKKNDELIPCVAVIDEDDNFGGNQQQLWNQFRTKYPSRPFCLLIPNANSFPINNTISMPPNFINDTLVTIKNGLIRDNGNVSLAYDWRTMCGLNSYTSANVPWVGLFVDDSGSMTRAEVIASINKFQQDMNKSNIQIKEVVNGNENWILPFLTTLVPNATTP